MWNVFPDTRLKGSCDFRVDTWQNWIAVHYRVRDVFVIQEEFQKSICTKKTDAPLTDFTNDIRHVRNLKTVEWIDVKGIGDLFKRSDREAHVLLQNW